jgi:hypothetical protein
VERDGLDNIGQDRHGRDTRSYNGEGMYLSTERKGKITATVLLIKATNRVSCYWRAHDSVQPQQIVILAVAVILNWAIISRNIMG